MIELFYMKNIKYLLVGFLAVAFALLIVPSAGSASTATSTETSTPVQWCYNFKTNLKIKMGGIQVENLQIALEKERFSISKSEKDKKYFGESTASAVSGFQQKYKKEILAPLGLQHETGFVGPATRAKLNSLYGCAVVIPVPTPIANITTSTSKWEANIGLCGVYNACDAIFVDSNLDLKLSIGQKPGATDGDDGYYDVPAFFMGSPGGPPSIIGYIDLQGQKYWRDIRSICITQSCTKQWNIYLELASTLSNKTLGFRWNSNYLPSDANITFTDITTGQVTDMKQTSKYVFEYTKGERQFRVNVTKTATSSVLISNQMANVLESARQILEQMLESLKTR